MLSRALRRGLQTGRVIPPTVLRETIKAVPRSVQALAPLADYCVRIDNVSADVLADAAGGRGRGESRKELEQQCPQGEEEQEQQQQQQHEGGSLAASSSSETVAAEATEAAAAAERTGDAACGRTREVEVPLPLLATAGETWGSFRETFSQEQEQEQEPPCLA